MGALNFYRYFQIHSSHLIQPENVVLDKDGYGSKLIFMLSFNIFFIRSLII